MHLQIKEKSAYGDHLLRPLAAGAEGFIKHADNLAYLIDPLFYSSPFTSHLICFFENVDGNIRYSFTGSSYTDFGKNRVIVDIFYAQSSEEVDNILRKVLRSIIHCPSILYEDGDLDEVSVYRPTIPEEPEERAKAYIELMNKINSLYRRRICKCQRGFIEEGEEV